jgi:hypothetical protein
MGQYYKPINIDKLEHVYSHDYGSGLKLMEHSWIGNEFVGAVMTELKPGGRWYKNRIIWAGDYGEATLKDFKTDDEITNLTDELEDTNDKLYSLVEESGTQIKPESMSATEQQEAILVNHTTKQYVIYNKLPKIDNDWTINPLPLLTADGNGNGGGDYYGKKDIDLLGAWAGHVLSIESSAPAGYTEIEPKFKE